ncbi:MAG TPA: tetratricopeptide repeat protein [Chryseolinea sp.]|nr:tetratricopeptide repeat protein [Chryseolinea sp.]
MKWLLPVFAFCIMSDTAFGQAKRMSWKEAIEAFNGADDRDNNASRVLFDSLNATNDTASISNLARQLQLDGAGNNNYKKARGSLFKARMLYRKDYMAAKQASSAAVIQLLNEGMHAANETNDEYLIAYISQSYSELMIYYKKTELAVMYGMYSSELYEKNFGVREFPYYTLLADLMYNVREYRACIDYGLKWLGKNPATASGSWIEMSTLNTVALAYHRLGQYDSAMYYYNNALATEKVNKRRDWIGIISGNMGQVYYALRRYDTARYLLEKDYRISMEYHYFDNAANSLQWAARANAAMGNETEALRQVRESMVLIRQMPDSSYLQNIYFAAVEIFRLNGEYDSALYYAGLYEKQHEAIEKQINLSSVAISRVRMNEEKSLYNIRRLQLEKQSQKQQRNFIVLGIFLLCAISILIVNRQRLKLKHRQQSLQQENRLIENEMSAAKEQMTMFTQNIIEKASLIEKLEQQMKLSHSISEQQQTITTLSSLTILTEEDWEKFKTLFEKIYPMFFQKLKTAAPDITLAEQRMAALTRLHLTTRQMASMQGISPDSVHKTRQRLRLRLGISNETNMEEYFLAH